MLTTTGHKNGAPHLKEVIVAVSIQEIIVKRHKRKWESYCKLKEVINAAYRSEEGNAWVELNRVWPWGRNIYTHSLTIYYSYANERRGRRLIVSM